MNIPKADGIIGIGYGQYDSDGNVYPSYGSASANLTPKPADSISISLEFLRGVDAAAKWAHDNYEEPEWTDIAEAVTAAEVARLREEATK